MRCKEGKGEGERVWKEEGDEMRGRKGMRRGKRGIQKWSKEVEKRKRENMKRMKGMGKGREKDEIEVK